MILNKISYWWYVKVYSYDISWKIPLSIIWYPYDIFNPHVSWWNPTKSVADLLTAQGSNYPYPKKGSYRMGPPRYVSWFIKHEITPIFILVRYISTIFSHASRYGNAANAIDCRGPVSCRVCFFFTQRTGVFHGFHRQIDELNDRGKAITMLNNQRVNMMIVITFFVWTYPMIYPLVYIIYPIILG